MAYSKTLVDSIGRTHPRKNRYIIDLINASDEQRKSLEAKKDQHPYNIELKSFKEKEKVFLEGLEKEAREKVADGENKKLSGLIRRNFMAERKVEFYKEYIDLSYDAELSYHKAEHETRHIPEIISNDAQLKKDLASLEAQLSKIDETQRAKVLKEIEEKTNARKERMNDEINDLKKKYKDGIISKKALGTEKKIRKRAAQEDITAYTFLDEKKSTEEEIKNIKHHLNVDLRSKLNVLESDVSDVRRKTPIEVEKTKPVISYLTALIPGLGQLLNKQKEKAFFFFLGALFIYLVAIPYALGFGNYQGNGVSGLITLAEGGKRLDKSIIFMIEGVISLILLALAIFVFVVSFKDVHKVEKEMIKGVRRRTWFETKQSIETDGFPYVVSSPAAIVILFIVLVPIFTTVLISFTNYDPDHQSKFQWFGLQNYKLLATGQGVAGKAFWPIVVWTLIWTFGATTLAIAIGFILSLIANQDRIKFKGFFRTVYLLPWAVPAFITIMFFSQMMARNGPITGLINDVFGVALDIKNNTLQTRLALMLLQGWLGSAYVFLLSTGILQGIPSDLYEAAEIDGATGFQRTLKITIPLVLFQTGPLLIGQYTFNFNNFSIIHLFNGGGPFNPSVYGNVAGSTDLLISYIYKLTINNSYQGMGAAVTIIVSLVLMFFSWLGFRNTKAFKEQ